MDKVRNWVIRTVTVDRKRDFASGRAGLIKNDVGNCDGWKGSVIKQRPGGSRKNWSVWIILVKGRVVSQFSTYGVLGKFRGSPDKVIDKSLLGESFGGSFRCRSFAFSWNLRLWPLDKSFLWDSTYMKNLLCTIFFWRQLFLVHPICKAIKFNVPLTL